MQHERNTVGVFNMPAVVNRHGLVRSIPASVKRAVRQRDGFGCIICGKAIYKYEHFEPEFEDSFEHSADGIVLLCSEHHDLKTRGFLSKATIRQSVDKPICKELGFSFGPFDIGTQHPEIILGQLTCRDVRCLISLDGDEIFSVLPPSGAGLPFRLNADLKDSTGQSILKIVDNEWRSEATNWDVTVIGATIAIRNAPRSISLVLRVEPPERIVIERLDMKHKQYTISCRENENLSVSDMNGVRFSAHSTSFQGFDTAVSISEGILSVGISRPRYPVDLGFIGFDRSETHNRNSRCECSSTLRYKHCHRIY